MKLLLGVSPSKIFHMKEFVNELEKISIECRLVLDTDVSDGFPSRKLSNWFQSRKKFEDINREFNPDAANERAVGKPIPIIDTVMFPA